MEIGVFYKGLRPVSLTKTSNCERVWITLVIDSAVWLTADVSSMDGFADNVDILCERACRAIKSDRCVDSKAGRETGT